jgi:hypothetical protein
MNMWSYKPRFVYFIRPIGMQGPIKIGSSMSPTGRRDTLSTWSPFPLEILAEMPGGFDVERRLHAKHYQSSIGREWFNWTPELQADIDAVIAGTFEVEALPPRIPGGGNRPIQKRSAQWGRQQSYSLRATHTFRKTGYRCPVATERMVYENDLERIAKVEAYLSDPAKHGVPIDAAWAVEKRKAC